MTDELKALKAALRKSTPKSSARARGRAIAQAMTAYDEKFSRGTQGSRAISRLTDMAHAATVNLFGRAPMRLNPALAGSASLAALTVAVMTTVYIQNDLRNPQAVVPEPQASGPTRQTSTIPADKPDGVPPPPKAGSQPQAQPSPAVEVRKRAEEEMAKPQFDVATRAPTGGNAAQDKAIVTVNELAALRGEQDAVNARATPLAPALPLAPAPAGIPMAAVTPQIQAKRFSHTPGQPPVGGYARTLTDTLGNRVAVMPPRPAPDQVVPQYEAQGRDKFDEVKANPVKQVSSDPVSTFSVDVDTASYAFVRASLSRNVLPQKNAVRVEELINYFPYDYARPDDKSVPFKTTVNVFETPWNSGTRLMHIGIKGYDLQAEAKPRSNLVFLLDTSGSMNAPNKLPLLQNSLKLMLDTMRPDDTIAIVTYAGSAGTVLEPTPVKDKAKIIAALNNLHAGGSTAGAEGIRQAYELASQGYDAKAVNRVILATDGDFNVGITNHDELKSFIERKRESGVFLSVLGFGMGNYNDALMQTLAQNGNGNAAYIDTLNEARKVLVEEASSTLFPIAKDVKIQIEFNPSQVSEYRLIGYETRLLNREDFKNDKVDAGDIGAGHTVTAIYEITPKGSRSQLVGDLRYAPKAAGPAVAPGGSDEYAFVKLRYKLPDENTSKLIEMPVGKAPEAASIGAAPQEARFATSVAAFGQLLTGGRFTGTYSYDDVIALAQSAKGPDSFGYRAEFINLARFAKSAAALEAQK